MAKRFAFGPFLLDTGRGTLLRDGAPVAVGRRGLLVLQALLDASGAVVTKDALMRFAWPGLVVEESNLSVQVAALRRLMGPAPEGSDWVATVPRAGYRLAADIAVQDFALDATAENRGLDNGGRPSIAVLPFGNLSDDPAQEHVVDGITEDLIAALTRYRWFQVIGRNSSFVYKARPVDSRTAAQELGVRYLLEGSLRKSGARVRIAVELVDARNGRCLWADRYEFAAADAFAVEDRITRQVAGAIEPELLKRESELAASQRRAVSATGWELVAQGAWCFHHVTQSTHMKARELFRQACRLDQELVEAKLWLGRVSVGIVAYGWSGHPDEDLREGLDAALQAVQMDEKSPYAHYALAITSAYSDSPSLAIPAAEKAIELSPSFALGHLVLGAARLFCGDAAAAMESLENGLLLNRYDPQNFIWYNVLALACLFGGRPGDALQRAQASLQIRPTWRSSLETAVACCSALGRSDAAQQWAEQMAVTPKAPGDALQPLWRHNPLWAGAMRELLAGASNTTNRT